MVSGLRSIPFRWWRCGWRAKVGTCGIASTDCRRTRTVLFCVFPRKTPRCLSGRWMCLTDWKRLSGRWLPCRMRLYRHNRNDGGAWLSTIRTFYRIWGISGRHVRSTVRKTCREGCCQPACPIALRRWTCVRFSSWYFSFLVFTDALFSTPSCYNDNIHQFKANAID